MGWFPPGFPFKTTGSPGSWPIRSVPGTASPALSEAGEMGDSSSASVPRPFFDSASESASCDPLGLGT